MKVQILYLEHFDDRVSAREKLNWARADRVLMVWPDRGEILTSRLDLILLQRQASVQQIQLGLVSHDPSVRRHAHDLGLPVFDDLDNLPEKRWGRGRPAARPSTDALDPAYLRREQIDLHGQNKQEAGGFTPRTRRILFGLGLGAILVLAGAILPSAQVIVGPEVRTVAASLQIPLADDEMTTYVGIQPVMEPRSVVVEGSLRRATTAATTAATTNRQPTVSSSDLTELQDELEEALLQAGAETIESQLDESERLLEGSLIIDRVLAQEFDASAGEPAATVGLEMEVELRALVVQDEDLQTFARSSLEDQIPAGWAVVPNSLSYDLAEISRRSAPYLDFQAELRIFHPRALESVASSLPGLPVDRARQEVRRLLDVNDVTFDLSPEWMPWLPFLPNRISLLYPWERG